MILSEFFLSSGRNIARLAHYIRCLGTGWRLLLAFSCGVLGAFAMPPFGLWPVLFISVTLIIWLIDGIILRGPSRKKAMISTALTGWFFGFGYFVAGLWWLGAAFLVEADAFLWALPIGVVGLPMLLALFTAFGFSLAGSFWHQGTQRVFLFAAALSLSEWLRGNILTGFPWNSWGMAFGQGEILAQGASLGGLHWLTVIALFIHAAPATLADSVSLRRRLQMPVAAVGIMLALVMFGLCRIPSNPVPVHKDVRLRIMQPNIAETEQVEPGFRDNIVPRYIALSAQHGMHGEKLSEVTHLIWPESAFPFLIDYAPAVLNEITRILPMGAFLITGAARADLPLPGEQNYRYFNAIRVFDSSGTSIATYDKVHLVPFGEYLPFDDWLRRLGVRQFVSAPTGFVAGERRSALNVPSLPLASPLICYEAIFPEEAILPFNKNKGEPGFLLNLTNDAWFGMTPGPYQHFAQSRLRAIEQGMPMVRAANTGISAVIDPFGRIIAHLSLGIAGSIDAPLPQKISSPPYIKFYKKGFGAVIYWLTLIGFFSLGLIRMDNARMH